MPNVVPMLYKQLFNDVVWNKDKKKNVHGQCNAIIRLRILFIGSSPAEPTGAGFIPHFFPSFKLVTDA